MKSDRKMAIAVLLPSIILVGIFVYGFIAWTVYTSMTDTNALQQLSGLPSNFIGLKNYENLFNGLLENRFRIAIVNNVFFTVLFIAICLGMGLLLAVLLDQKIKGESIFRTIFLFPMSLSFVVTGVVWKWLFNPDYGVNSLPAAIGLPPGQFRWFISSDKWLNFNWQQIPTLIVMLLLGIVIFFALSWWNQKRSQAAAFMAAIALLLLATITFNVPSQAVKLISEPHAFNLALLAVVVAAGWQMSGYTMAMYLAGLRGISDDLREAARVDGATELGVYRYVVLPLLQPITLSAIIIL
ncbi:MAG TPA: sugar ABC transporter permease, partial [Phototrophicaceae bacterium]|nr:sugar ABC transporter permease [Phototrophicaceae bacterium]